MTLNYGQPKDADRSGCPPELVRSIVIKRLFYLQCCCMHVKKNDMNQSVSIIVQWKRDRCQQPVILLMIMFLHHTGDQDSDFVVLSSIQCEAITNLLLQGFSDMGKRYSHLIFLCEKSLSYFHLNVYTRCEVYCCRGAEHMVFHVAQSRCRDYYTCYAASQLWRIPL